ncbi:MAG TPA: hypothetical protein VE076_01620 [Nitrososphaeraceae archaeon]|nr:hypothetical protein [Nitrososphaeraceae archaeon]
MGDCIDDARVSPMTITEQIMCLTVIGIVLDERDNAGIETTISKSTDLRFRYHRNYWTMP